MEQYELEHAIRSLEEEVSNLRDEIKELTQRLNNASVSIDI